jgi:hypothetical protein
MKTTNCSFQIFKLAIATTVATVIMCGLSVRSTQAGYVVTLQQVGANVIATGSGAIDLTGLSGPTTNPQGPQGYISPSVTLITTGAGGVLADVYAAATLSGPTSFGTGFSCLRAAAAETTSASMAPAVPSTCSWCQWAMSPVMRYRTAQPIIMRHSSVSA